MADDVGGMGNVVDFFKSAIQSSQGTAGALSGYIGQSVGLSKDLQAAILAKGNADKIVNDAAMTGQMQGQQAALKVATALGTNMDNVGEQMTKLSQDRAQSYQDMVDVRDKIHQKESVQFLDDPLQYLLNTLTLPADREQLAYSQDKLNMAGQQQDNLITTTSASAAAQKAIAQTITQSSIDAAGESILDQAKENSLATKWQAMSFGAENLKAIQSLKEGNFRDAMALGQYEVAMSAKQIQDLADEQLYKAYTAASNAVGGQIMPLNSFKAARVNGLIDMHDPNQVAFVKQGIGILNGMNFKAENPLQAIGMIQSVNGRLTNDFQNNALGSAVATYQQMREQAKTGQLKGPDGKPIMLDLSKKPDQETFMQLVNAQVRNSYLAQMNTIPGNDTTNPYAPKGITNFGTVPQVAATNTYKNVLSGLPPNSTPDVVANAVYSAIKSGTVTTDDAAAALAGGYFSEQVHVNSGLDFNKIGLPSLDTSRTGQYNIQIATGSGLFGKGVSTVDVRDPLSWKLFFAKKISTDALRANIANEPTLRTTLPFTP